MSKLLILIIGIPLIDKLSKNPPAVTSKPEFDHSGKADSKSQEVIR